MIEMTGWIGWEAMSKDVYSSWATLVLEHKKSSNNSHNVFHKTNQPITVTMWQNKVLIIRTAHMLMRPQVDLAGLPIYLSIQLANQPHPVVVTIRVSSSPSIQSTWLDIISIYLSLSPKYTTKLCSTQYLILFSCNFTINPPY